MRCIARGWYTVTLLGALLLAGCGGGSDGNDPPAFRANNDSYNIAPGGSLSIAAPGVLGNDTAGNGAALSASLVTNVRHGTLTLNPNGSFTYQHDGSNNSDSFVYRANNGSTTSNDATVTLAFSSTPLAFNSCHSPTANTSYTGQLSAAGQSIVYEIIDQPTKGSLTTDAAGNFTYVPRSSVRGFDQFTFRVRDATGGQPSNTATVSLFIDGALRIMPLGDSITMGTYTATSPSDDRSIGYRLKLYNDLASTAAGRYNVDFVGTARNGETLMQDPDHEGHGGYLAQQIADGINQWLTAAPPDIVLLHIGTNDLSTNPNASAAPVSAILQNIESWGQANYPPWVFVARIIERTDGSSVTAYNDDIAARVAARNNNRLFLVNQQTGAQLIYSTSGDMADNVHPNQSGYDKMANKWRADMLAAGILPSCP